MTQVVLGDLYERLVSRRDVQDWEILGFMEDNVLFLGSALYFCFTSFRKPG